MIHQKRPCDECPWRTDVDTGRFSAARFEALADTARDMSMQIFACHKSKEGKDAACAGFLLRGADHNMSVRLAMMQGRYDPESVTDGGHDLYDSYADMALANGASRSALRGVRVPVGGAE